MKNIFIILFIIIGVSGCLPYDGVYVPPIGSPIDNITLDYTYPPVFCNHIGFCSHNNYRRHRLWYNDYGYRRYPSPRRYRHRPSHRREGGKIKLRGIIRL